MRDAGKVQELEARVAKLEKVLFHTRVIICEGAITGFNPIVGDWAERLFYNNARIADVLDKIEEELNNA